MSSRTLLSIQVTLASAAMLIGVLGLVGWLWGVQSLIYVAGSQSPLAFNSAVALVLFGLAVIAVETGRRTVGRWLGVVLLSLGGATVLQFTLGWRLGLEPLWMARLFVLPEGQTGQMSLFAAFTCVLLGSALCLGTFRRRFPGAIVILTAVVMADAVVTVGGYFIDLETRADWGLLTGMSLFAAVGVFMGAGSLLLWARQLVPLRDRSTADALGIFAVASMVMFGVGLAAWTSNEMQRESGDEVSRSFEVIDSANYAELCLTRMESAARGYTLSKQEPYADYYNDIERRLLAEFRQLRHLVDDNPAQMARVGELVQLMNIKRAFMRQVIDGTRTGALEFKRETFNQPTGADLMAKVRAKGNEIEQAERTRLASREARTDGVSALTGRVIVSGEFLAGALALIALYFIRRTDRARLTAQDELTRVNEGLEQRVEQRTAELQTAVGELVERERSRRFMADAIPQPVWTVLPDGSAETFNRSWCDYTGLTEQQSKEGGWMQVVHPDDAPETRRRARAIIAQGIEGGGEYRLRRAGDGAYRWMVWRARPEHDHDGRLVRWVGTTIDIHDQKEARAQLETLVEARTAELRESEERFRSSFDSAGIGMAIVGLDGCWLQVNRTTCEIVGYPEAELLQKTFQDITHPDDLGTDLANVQALLAGERRSYQMEKRYYHRDGRVVWINLTVSLVRAATGAPVHFVAQIEDIGVRKQLERSLQESQQMFQQLFESSPDAIVLVESGSRIKRANACAERLFGWPEGTMVGQLIETLLPDRYRANHGRHLAGYFRDPRARSMGAGMELFARRRDGGEFPVDIMLSPVETPQGNQALAVVRDITERKRAEVQLLLARDQALEASRLKSEFLANMSHEIRTPMNGIIGMSDLLMDTGLTPDQREMGLVIHNSAESLLTIINDVLDFSKIEAGKMRIESDRFELRSLIEEALVLLAPRAQAKKLELLCDFDPRLNIALRGDAGRIRQVLLNLASNAIKFTAAGEVIVAARWLHEGRGRVAWRMEVIDTGIGIPVAAQRKLFQPFVQADGSTTRRFGGTGLGLAISRQLVELMDGEIGFQSKEGQGSTFWIQLDLEKQPSAGESFAMFPSGRRALVAATNASQRRILLGQLAEFGVEADSVGGMDAATERIVAASAAGTPFELVMLDQPVAGPDLTSTVLALRATPAGANVPLVLLAPTTAPTATPDQLAARFAAVLTKPVREEQLARALHLILDGETRAAPMPPAVVPAASAAHKKLRLLVAEDNATNQIVIRRLLERIGHNADFAQDGAEALAQLARGEFDAVLMDCQMPGMDGYEATKQIRSGALGGVNPRIPVIALTAYAMPGDRQKCLDAGMNEYVAKPLRFAELTEALQRCGLHAESTAPAVETAPTTQAAESEFLDPRQVEQLRSLPGLTDAPLLHDLIRMFLVEMPAVISRLGEQLDRRAMAEIALTAHKLAGSCANLGARDLQNAALAVEKAARAEAWHELAGLVAIADREWLRLKFHLENLAAETSP